jgi:ADP-dependent phosphofructokinase/glucokinase
MVTAWSNALKRRGERTKDNGVETPHAIWAGAYGELAARLSDYSRGMALALCGLAICVDSVISLQEAGPLFDESASPKAKALAKELSRRAALGLGGEIKVDWPEGPGWLTQRLAFRSALGGTGAHAGRVLTICGGNALLAVADRSKRQLSLIDDDILIAVQGRPVRAAEVAPGGPGRPDIFIFEYTAGQRFSTVTPGRSSRVIVRFTDPDLDRDPDFVNASTNLAPQAGAAVLSGFNAVPSDRLEDALAWTQKLVEPWRDGGVPIIHFELAGYQSIDARERTIRSLAGLFNSIGMSLSEFVDLVGRVDLADGLIETGERLRVTRVCVHADHWAAAATRAAPETEVDALMAGCLLSSVRAATGEPKRPTSIPEGATFADPPFPQPIARGPWTLISCSAPYLHSPTTTLGLGDTFLAGCLLVLGTRDLRAAKESLRQ